MARAEAHASPEIVERTLMVGDLSELKPAERVALYQRTCESLGLNPLTKPFDYIRLNGKLTLYARRDCTDQLRKIHRVSITIVSRERIEDVYVVTARASMPDGREDASTGAVTIAGLKGENLSNALMKAETKAKRRVTLSIVGLGWLDETEVAAVPTAKPVHVTNDGEIVNDPVHVDTSAVEAEFASALENLKTPADARALYSKVLHSNIQGMTKDLLLSNIKELGSALMAAEKAKANRGDAYEGDA